MALEEAGFPPGIVETREVFDRRIRLFPEGFLLAEAGAGPAWGYFCSEIWSGWDTGSEDRFDLGHDIASWLDRDGDTLYIASMTVAPGARGSGRGRALFRAGLKAMAADFPRLRQAVLIVNEHWAGARAIYRGEGFVETGRIAGFFRPQGGPVGDAVLMHRSLSLDSFSP